MGLKLFLSTLLLCAAVLSVTDAKKSVVCYVGTWANYRNAGGGQGKYLIEDIDADLCTHAVYGFAKLVNNKITPYDPWLDLKDNWGLGGYSRFNKLRERNSELKTLIGLGGWNEGSMKYSDMVSKKSSRDVFVKSVVDFLEKYGFSGLDMDWEYPVLLGGSPEDKQNFVLLLKELKEAMKPKGWVLTAAVAAGKSNIDAAYDIPGVSKHLDQIHLMTYDFHGSWERSTGLNAPLYAPANATQQYKEFTIDYAVNYWLKGGASKDKLVMGFGLYGRSFTLEDSSNHGVGAPATGPGKQGLYTLQPGSLGYNEVCLHLKENGWEEEWAEPQQSPYAHKGDQWVSYDDKKSIQIKAEYAKKMGLAGGLVWSVDTDDFRGICYDQKNILLKTLADELWK